MVMLGEVSASDLFLFRWRILPFVYSYFSTIAIGGMTVIVVIVAVYIDL